jgi:putative ABC transport system permease protein
MLLLNFTIRRMFRYRFLLVLILLGLTLASGFTAALPSYAKSIAASSLTEMVDMASPTMRNIVVQGPPQILNVALLGDVNNLIGDMINTRIITRQLTISSAEFDSSQLVSIGSLDPESLVQIRNFRLWAIDSLSDFTDLTEGRMPNFIQPQTMSAMFQPPKFEAVIGITTSEKTGLGVGSVLEDISGSTYTIVGILEPLDPESDVWGIGAINPFDIGVRPINSNEDIITISMFTVPNSIKEYHPHHQYSWKFVMDREYISVDTVEEVQTTLLRLKTLLVNHGTALHSGMPEILTKYQGQLSSARQTLFLLSSQAFIFVLYFLSMLTSFTLEQAQGELSSLVSRGASRNQIILIFSLQGLLLALPAGMILGPMLAQIMLRFWAGITGAHLPSTIPVESIYLSLAASLFGWCAYVIPVISASKRNVLEWQSQMTRPSQHANWQRRYLDLLLFGMGGLAYWQLSISGSFIMGYLKGKVQTDPFLLIGPTMMLIACGLVFLRIFPILLRFVAWVVRRTRGITLNIGISRLARFPTSPNRIVLLISMAAALTFFASVFQDTLDTRQEQIARYITGADLRVSLTEKPDLSLTNLPGVLEETTVFRSQLNIGGPMSEITVFAVDPETFKEVSYYPPGVSPVPMATIMKALSIENEGFVPGIFSKDVLPYDATPGDVFTFSLFGKPFDVVIKGNILKFPTLNDKFIIVNKFAMEQNGIDLHAQHLKHAHELWLSLDSGYHESIVNEPRISEDIMGDAQNLLRNMRADALSKGAIGAFKLNALILVILSVVGFFLVNLFSARTRNFESGLLRSIGMSTTQLLGIFMTEGALVMVLGLLSGTTIGYGLSQLMRTFLSRTLRIALTGASTYQKWIVFPFEAIVQPVSFPSAILNKILVDWKAIGNLYGVLAICYIIAIILLIMVLLRAGIHRVLRIGEE